ncbi:hypothetical protein D917_07706, partial [Trichinella nativa]
MIWSSCSEISAAIVIPNSKIKICKLWHWNAIAFLLYRTTDRNYILVQDRELLSSSDDTDPEYVPDDPEDEFDPAGELEVEEELDVEEFEDIKLSQKQRGALPQWKKSEDLVEQLQPNENLQNMASLTLL